MKKIRNFLKKKSLLFAAILMFFLLEGCGCPGKDMQQDPALSKRNEHDSASAAEEYFEWNGNIITGLTEAGEKAESLVIPDRCVGFGSEMSFRKADAETISFEDDAEKIREMDRGCSFEKQIFTKSFDNKFLDAPLIAWIYKYDEDLDFLSERSASQRRYGVEIDIDVQSRDFPWETIGTEEQIRSLNRIHYYDRLREEKYGVQQASLINDNGTAVFSVIRALPSSSKDFPEKDYCYFYDYYGIMMFTDGTSSAQIWLEYNLFDELHHELFDEAGEAGTKTYVAALLAKYRFDYDSLKWEEINNSL